MNDMKFLTVLFRKKPKVQKIDLTRRFDLIARVGQGSMSKVWRARDTMTGKIVALKVLDPEKTQRFESRFIGLNKPTEGEVSVPLRHQHIVHSFEHGISRDNEQYLVMEFIEGVGLSYLIDMQNQLMQDNRLRFVIQVGQALDYFHKKNWIHRDLCPRNVLVDQQHQIKLIDFGLAVPNTPDFQKPGNRTGTPSYMAPELIKRQKTDQRIDVFSYASTCFEMYTSRLPWEAAESIELVMQHINTPPGDIREHAPDIDEQIAEIIMQGLELRPQDRWPSVSHMLSQLRKAHLRLSGDDEFDPEFAEPVVDEAVLQRRSRVVYWQPEDDDDVDEYEDVGPVTDQDGYEDVDTVLANDDDEYEEVDTVLDE